MGLDTILRQISQPQVVNTMGALGQSLLQGGQFKANQQQYEQKEQRFKEVTDQNALIAFTNDINSALSMGPGQAQDDIVKNALTKVPEGSAPHMVAQNILSMPGEQKQAMLKKAVEDGTRAGFLQPQAQPDQTSDIKNFEFAKSQGYTGSFTDFQKRDGVDRDARTAEIKNFEYGQKNPEFKEMRKKADESKLTDHELRLATMLANGDIDASQLPKRGGTYNKIVSGAKELNPELNIRSGTADYVLSKNPTFRQKAMTAEVLPDIMGHIVEAGKKVDFSNIRKFGNLQKFYKENVNDPDLVEYMALRNDGLMEIASVMRGAGMTDKAHEAEVEAMNPTLSPRGLDAWYKAQMKALKPRLKIINKIIEGKEKQKSKKVRRKYNPTTGGFD